MSNKMWGGRFTERPDAIMEEINVSIDVDRHLYRQDIAASKAHAAMLAAQGIITASDAKNIGKGLDTILSEIGKRLLRFQARARRHPYECREPAHRTDRAAPPDGCIPRARATTRSRPISGSRCATPSTRPMRRWPLSSTALADTRAGACRDRRCRVSPICRPRSPSPSGIICSPMSRWSRATAAASPMRASG